MRLAAGRVLGRVDPESKDPSVKAAALGGLQVEVSAAQWANYKVPGLVQEALRGICVAVDNERREVLGA